VKDERHIQVVKLGRSRDVLLPDKVSYQVTISEGTTVVKVELRIKMSTFETLENPEKWIKEWIAARPLPTSSVIDI
jgi:hypothetical protein